MTRLCILVTALAVIARTRVTVLPGWVVPVPALFLAITLAVCAALVALIVLRVRGDRPPHPWLMQRATPGPAAETAAGRWQS